MIMRNFLIIVSVLVLSMCSSVSEPVVEVENYEMTLNSRLEQNADGYYLLTVIDNGTQTIHRISGNVTLNNEPLEYQRVIWESSHYWFLSDSVAFIIRRNHCPTSQSYNIHCVFVINSGVVQDTVYLSQFEGMEVPTVNMVSLSAADGEINTIFAPIYAMRGDTVEVTAYALFPTGEVGQSINIILR